MDLVDVAVFTFSSQAGVLESMLQAEKIEYFTSNEAGSVIVPGTGVTLSVREKDVERTVELIKQAGLDFALVQ